MITSELQGTTKYLPPIGVAAYTMIVSTSSSTVLTQTFVNPLLTEDILECTYVFPLYAGISVISFVGEVGSRTINGVVKEKVEAQEVYDQAIKRGETAGLLKQGPTSDVFMTTLGNIPAGEKLTVNITYVGELKQDMGMGGIRFTLPTAISPRYGAVQPQATRSPTSADAITITVDIDMPKDCPIKEVRSPSHPIALTLGSTAASVSEQSNPSRASVSLSLDASALDKDFVLEVLHQDIGKPRAILELHPDMGGQRALMATLVPEIAVTKGSKPEIIVVADQSGSMDGGRTTTLVSALHILLKSVPHGSKFNVCAFGSAHRLLWEKSQEYDEKSLAEALSFVKSFNASYGGTETLSAVKASLQSRDEGRNLSIILATDGDIWQQQELFSYLNEEVAKSKTSIRVFPLGIGNSVSSALIEGVARAGNGFAQTVGEGEKQDSKIVRMLKGALTPDSGSYTMEVQYGNKDDDSGYVLVERVTDSLRIMMIDDEATPNAQLDRELRASAMVVGGHHEDNVFMADSKGGEHATIPKICPPKLLQTPQVIPPLYPLSRTTIYILLSPSASHLTPKSVIFRNDSPDSPFEVTIPIETLPKPGTTIHSLAAKRAILELEEGRGWLLHAKDNTGTLLKESHKPTFPKLIEAECVRLGTQFQVAGKHTSFVAIESNTSDPSASKVLETLEATTAAAETSAAEISAAAAPSSTSGRTQRTARMSKGGKAPRTQLASVAARRTGSYPCQVQHSSGPAPKATTGRGLGTGGRFRHRRIIAPTIEAEMDVDDVIDYSEDEEEKKTKEKEETDPLQRIVQLQAFAGYWAFDEGLLKAVGISGDNKVPDGLEKTEVWGTILAIVFLEVKVAEEKEAWEMVVEKGRMWLEGEGVDENDGQVKGWWERARELLGGA